MRYLVYFCCFGLLYFARVAAEQWLVPGATNATADNGFHYATDLKLCNQGPLPPRPHECAAGRLGAHGTKRRVYGSPPIRLVIAANVCTDAGESGSYGFELDAIPYERWTTAGAAISCGLPDITQPVDTPLTPAGLQTGFIGSDY